MIIERFFSSVFHENLCHGSSLVVAVLMTTHNIGFIVEIFIIEPSSEKTDLWGFRPGSTQIGLYNH